MYRMIGSLVLLCFEAGWYEIVEQAAAKSTADKKDLPAAELQR
jgi:hypothetical protein